MLLFVQTSEFTCHLSICPFIWSSFQPHKVGQMGIIISHFASEGVMLKRRHLDERVLGNGHDDILQCYPVRYISRLLFPPFVNGTPLCRRAAWWDLMSSVCKMHQNPQIRGTPLSIYLLWESKAFWVAAPVLLTTLARGVAGSWALSEGFSGHYHQEMYLDQDVTS